MNFKIQTLDKQEIKVVGYNDIADYILKNLKKNDKILINGIVNTNMEIELKEFEKFKDK